MSLIDEIKFERRWFKKAVLIATYHCLQCMEFPEPRPKGWTIQKTADALGLSIGYISESMKLAREYKDKPVGLMSREEALEALKKNG